MVFSLVCVKWRVFSKQELILSSIVLVTLKEWLVLRATLKSNFHSEIDFAHSSIKFTSQVGNKYEIISEKLKFLQDFLVGTFGILECDPNLAASSSILQELQLLVLENTDHQNL